MGLFFNLNAIYCTSTSKETSTSVSPPALVISPSLTPSPSLVGSCLKVMVMVPFAVSDV